MKALINRIMQPYKVGQKVTDPSGMKGVIKLIDYAYEDPLIVVSYSENCSDQFFASELVFNPN